MFKFLLKAKHSKVKFPSRFEIKKAHPIHPILCSTISNHSENINEISTSNLNQNIKTYSVKEMYLESDLLFFLTESSMIYIYNTVMSSFYSLLYFSTAASSAKSITINKSNNCLLVVYVSNDGHSQELKCVEVPIEIIKQQQRAITRDCFRLLFEREVFISPSFIEFDDVNNIILTKNALGTFKVWKMENYTMIFELTDKRIEEVRLAEDVLLTIKSTNVTEKLLLGVYDIKNGKNLYNYEIDLIPNSSLIFLALFRHVLFLKQEFHVPIFINMINLDNTFFQDDFNDDAFFIYNNLHKIILAFNLSIIYFYDLNGKLLNKLTKKNNVGTITPNDIAISNDKKYLCVCWKFLNDESNDSSDVLRKSQSIESKRSLLSGTRSKRSQLFSCSISSIDKSDINNIGMIEEDTFNEMHYGNCIDIINLDEIEKGVSYSINLNVNMNISSLLFDSTSMNIYYVTVFGEIYEISL